MPKPKKGDPELLLVSFCDIVTIVTAALFMAMIVVIDESSRIPSVRPMPLLRSTTNAPTYFECREGQVFPVDRAGLQEIFREQTKAFAQSKAGSAGGKDSAAAIQEIMKIDAGNDLYRLDPQYLLMGIMALIPKDGPKGTTVKEILDSSTNAFHQMVAKLDPASQLCYFIVREDGFDVFRRARDLAASKKFTCGWEVLDRNDRIVFAGAMNRIGIQ